MCLYTGFYMSTYLEIIMNVNFHVSSTYEFKQLIFLLI